jgi:hypothetical protein
MFYAKSDIVPNVPKLTARFCLFFNLGKNKEPIMMDFYNFSAVVPIPNHQIIKITDSTQWTTSKYFALIEFLKCFVQ